MAIFWLDIYAGHTSGGLGTFVAPWSMYEMYQNSKGALMAPGDELRITGKLDSVLFENLTNTFSPVVSVVNDNYMTFSGTIANNTSSNPTYYETLFFPTMCDNSGLFVPTQQRQASQYYLGSTWYANGVPVAGTFADVKRVVKTTAGALSLLAQTYQSFLKGANGTAMNPITVTSGWDSETTQNGRSLYACGYTSTWYLYAFQNCSNISVNCPDLMAINGPVYQHCQFYTVSVIDSVVIWGGIANVYASSYSGYLQNCNGLDLTIEQVNNGGGFYYIGSNSGTAAPLTINKLGGGYYGGITLGGINTAIGSVTIGWMWGNHNAGYLLNLSGTTSAQTVTINSALVVSGSGSPARYKAGSAAVVFGASCDLSNARYAYGAQVNINTAQATILAADYDYSNALVAPSIAVVNVGALAGKTVFMKDVYPPAGFAGAVIGLTDASGGSVVVQRSSGFTEYLPRGSGGVVAITSETANIYQSAPGMKFDGQGAAGVAAMGYKSVQVPGVAGVAMTVNAWVNQSINVGVYLSITAIKYAGGARGSEVVATGSAAVGVGVWEQISATFTPDVDGDVELRIAASSFASGDVLYLSDISIA